jgi:signal transduction histidine kinase
MDERAQLLGSSLTIESDPGSGTTVLVEAPV